MRTTITIDDKLVEDLKFYFEDEKLPTLIHKGLKNLIAKEASRRLAALGGSMPDAEAAPRKRPWLVAEDETPYNATPDK